MNLTHSEALNMNASTSSEIVWKAQWLLSPAVGGPRSVPPAGYLRREFTVPEGSRATLSLPEGWIASPATFAPGIHTVRAAARRSPVSH